MTKKYNASSIEVIENLEAVRKRPGMYIGDTDFRGFHHLFTEIIDNSIDEYLAGFCDTINITLKTDNSIIIEDNGRGIPVDIHPKTKKPAVETILTVLHAGGKFGGENSGYRISGGLHGVGSSVVNALSSFMNVTIFRDGYEYSIKFANGGKVVQKLKKNKKSNKHGTIIHFKPDLDFFTISEFSPEFLINKIQELAFLNKNLVLTYFNESDDEKTTFTYPEGLIDYVDFLAKAETGKNLSKTFFISSEDKEISIDVALRYLTSNREILKSFVNNINTPDGGSHERAFKVALVRAINDYANSYNLKEKGLDLEYSDLKEGIVVVISVYIIEKHLQFEGQTKSKLSSKFVQKFVEKIVYNSLIKVFSENHDDVKIVIEKAYIAKKAREAARKAREVSRELSKSNQKSFVGKLVPAQSKNKKQNEIFLVEGDSAGGSAKLARERKHQAILPLKGKIVNIEKAKLKEIVSNDELLAIITSIGAGFGNNFDISKSNYGKIIIMTDADTDGAHIQTLLLTFFFRYMKPLIDQGMVYIALPPLYKVTKKGQKKDIVYFWSDEELAIYKETTSNIEVQRYKGLGEMNYQQLWDTTMNPEVRKLIRVTIEDFEEANKIIETLMGQDAGIRKKWINENIKFEIEDNFEI